MSIDPAPEHLYLVHRTNLDNSTMATEINNFARASRDEDWNSNYVIHDHTEHPPMKDYNISDYFNHSTSIPLHQNYSRQTMTYREQRLMDYHMKNIEDQKQHALSTVPMKTELTNDSLGAKHTVSSNHESSVPDGTASKNASHFRFSVIHFSDVCPCLVQDLVNANFTWEDFEPIPLEEIFNIHRPYPFHKTAHCVFPLPKVQTRTRAAASDQHFEPPIHPRGTHQKSPSPIELNDIIPHHSVIPGELAHVDCRMTLQELLWPKCDIAGLPKSSNPPIHSYETPKHSFAGGNKQTGEDREYAPAEEFLITNAYFDNAHDHHPTFFATPLQTDNSFHQTVQHSEFHQEKINPAQVNEIQANGAIYNYNPDETTPSETVDCHMFVCPGAPQDTVMKESLRMSIEPQSHQLIDGGFENQSVPVPSHEGLWRDSFNRHESTPPLLTSDENTEMLYLSTDLSYDDSEFSTDNLNLGWNEGINFTREDSSISIFINGTLEDPFMPLTETVLTTTYLSQKEHLLPSIKIVRRSSIHVDNTTRISDITNYPIVSPILDPSNTIEHRISEIQLDDDTIRAVSSKRRRLNRDFQFPVLPLVQPPKGEIIEQNRTVPQRRSTNKCSLKFPQRLMQILQEECPHETILSWTWDGMSIVIRDRERFQNEIMEQYFRRADKVTKYDSFVRQLHRWDFQRLTGGTGLDCFHHPKFRRDYPHYTQYMVPRASNAPAHNGNPTLATDDIRPSLAGIDVLPSTYRRRTFNYLTTVWQGQS